MQIKCVVSYSVDKYVLGVNKEHVMGAVNFDLCAAVVSLVNL